MASKRALRRKQCGKVAYDTASDAWKRVVYVRRRQGERLTTYACPHCAKFHVGHPNGRQRQALAAKLRDKRRLA